MLFFHLSVCGGRPQAYPAKRENGTITKLALGPYGRVWIDPVRQRVLADFVANQMLRTPKRLRPLLLLMLSLTTLSLALLAAVGLSGDASRTELIQTSPIFGTLWLVSALAFGWCQMRVRNMSVHPLIIAIQRRPGDIARITPLVVVISDGYETRPALTFEMRSGRRHTVLMGESTQAEFMRWLALSRQHRSAAA